MHQLLTKHITISHDQRGAVAVIVALCLIIFIGFTALAIDIGHLTLVRNELQNAADAAALAGAGALGQIYENMTYQQQQQQIDPASIIDTAQETGLQNYSDKVKNSTGLLIADSDVEVGIWTNQMFTATLTNPRAVRVTVRRNGAANMNSPVSNFFAGIIGSSAQTNVEAQAVAALSGQRTACLPIPIGISKYFFMRPPEEYCKKTLTFYPSNDPSSCGGWHFYTLDKNGDSHLRQLLDDLAAGTFEVPCNGVGDIYNFKGGTESTQVFASIEKLFNVMKIKNDGVWDRDSNSATWTATIPIYDKEDCSNPNREIPIWGFSTVVIEEVITQANEKKLLATVLCDVITEGDSGGPPEGNIGTIPLLVW